MFIRDRFIRDIFGLKLINMNTEKLALSIGKNKEPALERMERPRNDQLALKIESVNKCLLGTDGVECG